MLSRQTLANAIRFLAIDAIEQANSGHPGMPLGMADIAEVLWNDFIHHNPLNPHWFNRDRVVLSNGHGSMLLYAVLHLCGYDLSIHDLQAFRQLHSRTPGHPEVTHTPGVEATTGPLGQGFANAVGMAVAEKHLAAKFNQPHYPIINHYTYALVGDGCLMEGISHEAASLAAIFGLGKLIVLYDDNHISIDGPTSGWFQEDIPARFRAYGWHVLPEIDGHNPQAIYQAIQTAQAHTNQPSLLCCQTTIGFGVPDLAGSARMHGAPLGAEHVARTRKHLNWPYDPFVIPNSIYQAWDKRAQGQVWEQAWQQQLKQYQIDYPDHHTSLMAHIQGQLPKHCSTTIHDLLAQWSANNKSIATRQSSQIFLNALAPQLPLVAGSADLTESNLTRWESAQSFSAPSPQNSYIHYGVREFAMTAIANGLALHGGIIPVVGTFLVFMDYARNAVRMAALMKQRVILIYTHDSIGLGEDGPTHQPIEHINMLRMTPNMSTWRPCDTVECIIAWQKAIERQDGPTALLLSRQALPAQTRDQATIALIQRGGYILKADPEPQLILVATGSEVSLIVKAATQLQQLGYAIQVVSMPSPDTFNHQSQAYQQQVLPPKIPRLFVEAGAPHYWYQYTTEPKQVIGIEQFGASAPYQNIYQWLHLTVEHIVQTAQHFL